MIEALDVPCPLCGAERGRLCASAMSGVHYQRVEQARLAHQGDRTLIPAPWTLTSHEQSGTILLSNGQESWRFGPAFAPGTSDQMVYEFLRSLVDHQKGR